MDSSIRARFFILPVAIYSKVSTNKRTLVHVSVTKGALWDICLMQCGIYEMDLYHDRWGLSSLCRNHISNQAIDNAG